MQRMPPSATMGFGGTFYIIRHILRCLRDPYCYLAKQHKLVTFSVIATSNSRSVVHALLTDVRAHPNEDQEGGRLGVTGEGMI